MTTPTSSYYILDETSLPTYMAQFTWWHKKPDEEDQTPIIIERLEAGNLNLVFKLTHGKDTTTSIIVKQALPYLRRAGEQSRLTLERSRTEASAYETLREHLSGFIPGGQGYIHFDELMCVLVIPYLKGCTLRDALIEKQQIPCLGEYIGRHLGILAGSTSSSNLRGKQRRNTQSRFANELCDITDKLFYVEPYEGPDRLTHDPQMIEQITIMRHDPNIIHAVSTMRRNFADHLECLCHGDLHTGSIMIVENSSPVMFDPEFATFGPMGFDLGVLIGNMLLSHVSHMAQSIDTNDTNSNQLWLSGELFQLWRHYQKGFRSLVNLTTSQEAEIMSNTLNNAIGFAGCEMIRRLVGIGGVDDIRGISDTNVKTTASLMALALGIHLLVNRDFITTITDLTNSLTTKTRNH